MTLIHMVIINEMFMMTQDQGHKIKGQCQICKFVKKLFQLYVINNWLNIDVIYTPDINWWDIDPRSRSQGQRSRSNMQCCKELVSTLYHESMIGYWWYLHTWLISIWSWSWPKVKITRSKVIHMMDIERHNQTCNMWQ